MSAKAEFSKLNRTLTTSELSEKIRVTNETIRLWRNKGLPHTQISERVILYNLDEVVDWLEHHNRKGSG